MNCREATVFISLHVGDDLPEEQVGALESHLESCALCEAEYESYAASRTALLGLREDFLALPGQDGTPGNSLWDDLSAQLEPATQAAASGGGRLLGWSRHPLFRGGLAAAVLAVASAPLWWNWGSAPQNTTTPGNHSVRPLMAGVDFGGAGEDRGLSGQPLQQLQDDGLTPARESVHPNVVSDFMQRNQGKGLLLDSQAPVPIAVPVGNSNPNLGSY